MTVTTHEWFQVNQYCAWCERCGTLAASKNFLQVGGEESAEEPPCAGWVWHDVSESVDEVTAVAAVRWCSNEDVDPGEVAITVNRRYHLFRDSAFNIRDDAFFFVPRLVLLPGMVVNIERPRSGRLRWLTARISPGAALDYIYDSHASYLHETRSKFFGKTP